MKFVSGKLVIRSGSISNNLRVEEKPAEVSSLLPLLKPMRLRRHLRELAPGRSGLLSIDGWTQILRNPFFCGGPTKKRKQFQ